MQLGKFICIEGIEGAGKTTHTRFIVDYLQQYLGQDVLTTREPGGTQLAEQIRTLLLETTRHPESMCAETELLLLFAARCQHIRHVIQPSLHRGQWVVSDRFTETSFAYQGRGRGISWDFIQQLASYVHQALKVDRVILLDIPASTAVRRLKSKRSALDRIEKESMEFFERAREGYLERAAVLPTLYRIIHADCAMKAVQEQLVVIINELLE